MSEKKALQLRKKSEKVQSKNWILDLDDQGHS